MPSTAVLQTRKQVTDFLKWEEDDRFSRDNVVIALGQNLKIGAVVGRIGTGAAKSAARAGNVGNGVFGAITVAAGVPPGVYRADVLTAAANGGTFEVRDPYSNIVGTGAIGTAFNAGGLGFTIADGSTDFAVGDSFNINVDDGAGTVAEFTPGASDGTQNAIGIVTDNYDATNVALDGAIVTRHAKIIFSGLVWKSGVTAAQKAAALTQLQVRNVLVMREV